jgi:flagellar biosynthesis protein FlhB
LSAGDDKESKSNEPTDKKISDAIAKGQVPVSSEVPVLFSFLALLIISGLMIAPMVKRIEMQLRVLLEGVGTSRLDSHEDIGIFITGFGWNLLVSILPVLLCLTASGIISALVQNPFQIAFDRIVPKFSRVSPGAGLSRIFGFRGFVDFLKSLFKLIAVGLIATYIVKSDTKTIFSTMIQAPQLIPETVLQLSIELATAVTLAALALAVGDTVWSRMAWRRDLRMSHQEIKEEHKDAEGNPTVKLRARSLARQRSSKRMVAAVPKATLIIANPTHYAIALRYVRNEGGAPVVVAKGLDIIALKIREVAEFHDIAVIENKPLARAMFDKVEVDAEIPSEFFMAVAEMIHYLQMRSVAKFAER